MKSGKVAGVARLHRKMRKLFLNRMNRCQLDTQMNMLEIRFSRVGEWVERTGAWESAAYRWYEVG